MSTSNSNTSTMAIAQARLYGSKRAETPQHEPILIITPAFDNSKVSAVDAMRAYAAKLLGIQSSAEHWHLAYHEQVRIPNIAGFSRVYVFTFTPEAEFRKHRGVSEDKMHAHIRDSWYLSSNWKQGPPSPELATTLIKPSQ